MKLLPLLAFFFAALTLPLPADLTEEQKKVPLELDSPDPKLAKIVLLAGSVSNKAGQHEYFAGCALLADCLRQTPGVWPVIAADGWPKNEAIFKGAKAVVVYADGGPKLSFLAPERWALLKSLFAEGAGFVMLHQSVDVPEDHAEELQAWLGAAWQKDIGCRGHWDMEFNEFPSHPILRGVSHFAAPLDGWLFNLHFAPGVVPLLRGAVPAKARTTADARTYPDRLETVGWAYERPTGGRSFGFTGCDLHRNWSLESQRRLVINGILWSARIPVPDDGAATRFDPASLSMNLDYKPAAPAAPVKEPKTN